MERTPEVPDDQPRLRAGLLLGLALAYLLAQVYVSAAALGANTDITVTIATVAQALPAVVGATLLSGVAAGLWAPTRLSYFSGGPRQRLLGGAAAGGVIGLVVGGGIMLTFGAAGGIWVLAASLFVAGVLGGLAAALPPPVLGAGLAAILCCIVVAILINLFQDPLSTLLGGGSDVPHLAQGQIWLRRIGPVIEGLVAAIVAYRFLRARDKGRPWPWYLLAGAGFGVFSLTTIAVSRIGGFSLYHLVSGFSSDDADYMSYLLQSGLTAALVAGFVGGIGSTIAIGRTLSRPSA
jgi:hypothetical protein